MKRLSLTLNVQESWLLAGCASLASSLNILCCKRKGESSTLKSQPAFDLGDEIDLVGEAFLGAAENSCARRVDWARSWYSSKLLSVVFMLPRHVCNDLSARCVSFPLSLKCLSNERSLSKTSPQSGQRNPAPLRRLGPVIYAQVFIKPCCLFAAVVFMLPRHVCNDLSARCVSFPLSLKCLSNERSLSKTSPQSGQRNPAPLRRLGPVIYAQVFIKPCCLFAAGRKKNMMARSQKALTGNKNTPFWFEWRCGAQKVKPIPTCAQTIKQPRGGVVERK